MPNWQGHTPMSNLPDDLTSEEAAILFATKYDEAISGMRNVLVFDGFQEHEYHAVLEECLGMMKEYVGVPTGLTVEDSLPLVEISDLLLLGRLTYEVYLRRESIADKEGL